MQEFPAYLIHLHRRPLYRVAIYRNVIISVLDIVVNAKKDCQSSIPDNPDSLLTSNRNSNHFVELVAVVSFRNIFEFASCKITILLEKAGIPVARIRQNH